MHAIVPSSAFTLNPSTPVDALLEYRFGSRMARHLFCATCGITSFYVPRSNPDGIAVTIACIDPGTVESVEVKQFDGRNWEASAAATGIAACSVVAAEAAPEVAPVVAPVAPPLKGRSNEFGQPIGPELVGWVPLAPPPHVALEGRYCTLQPLAAAAHAADLHAAWALAPDARGWTYLFAERPTDAAGALSLVAGAAARADERHYAVMLPAAAAGERAVAVGSLAFMRIDPAHGVLEIGHVNFTSPRLAATRAATEAVALLLRTAFASGFRRVEWKCDALNAPSRRAAARYGFAAEGVFRGAVVYKGRERDTAWFAITRNDWPHVEAALDAWLAADNFDERGVQRTQLRAGAWRTVVTNDGAVTAAAQL